MRGVPTAEQVSEVLPRVAFPLEDAKDRMMGDPSCPREAANDGSEPVGGPELGVFASARPKAKENESSPMRAPLGVGDAGSVGVVSPADWTGAVSISWWAASSPAAEQGSRSSAKRGCDAGHVPKPRNSVGIKVFRVAAELRE